MSRGHDNRRLYRYANQKIGYQVRLNNYFQGVVMSLRVFVGWVVAVLGLLVVLSAFGLNLGIKAPVPFIGEILIGIALIAVGVYLASGRPVITS